MSYRTRLGRSSRQDCQVLMEIYTVIVRSMVTSMLCWRWLNRMQSSSVPRRLAEGVWKREGMSSWAASRLVGSYMQSRIVSWHIDGLVQERRNPSALAMELRLSCTNPSIRWVLCSVLPMPSSECHRTLLTTSPRWSRWWILAWWHTAITRANVSINPDLCRHVASLGQNKSIFLMPVLHALLIMYILRIIYV